MKELQKDQYKTQVNIKIIIRIVLRPLPTNFRPQLEYHLKIDFNNTEGKIQQFLECFQTSKYYTRPIHIICIVVSTTILIIYKLLLVFF